MVFMAVALPVEMEVLVEQSCPGESSNIPPLSANEVSHAPQSVWAKDDAPEKISCILNTLDTSHLEMSPLNDDACENMRTMSVTLDTSHSEMSLLNDIA